MASIVSTRFYAASRRMSKYDQRYRHHRTNRNGDHYRNCRHCWMADWPLGKSIENPSALGRSGNPAEPWQLSGGLNSSSPATANSLPGGSSRGSSQRPLWPRDGQRDIEKASRNDRAALFHHHAGFVFNRTERPCEPRVGCGGSWFSPRRHHELVFCPARSRKRLG